VPRESADGGRVLPEGETRFSWTVDHDTLRAGDVVFFRGGRLGVEYGGRGEVDLCGSDH
jgi:hypothetical protein